MLMYEVSVDKMLQKCINKEFSLYIYTYQIVVTYHVDICRDLRSTRSDVLDQ